MYDVKFKWSCIQNKHWIDDDDDDDNDNDWLKKTTTTGKVYGIQRKLDGKGKKIQLKLEATNCTEAN